MKYILVLIASMAFCHLATKSANASEWGCEVLLCAASSNPSWHGVASCQPPMDRLISAMSKPGFAWPTCPEGGAGEPGHERYVECPAGWKPTGPENGNLASSLDLSRCTRTVRQCGGRDRFGHQMGAGTEISLNGVTRLYTEQNSCIYAEYIPRPLRKEPYFFDIIDNTTRQVSRFWFSLQK